MPKKLQDKIIKQEKNIELRQKEVESNNKIGDWLEKKLKINKKNLLIYKSHESNRMKNEVKDLIEYTANDFRSTTINNWYIHYLYLK